MSTTAPETPPAAGTVSARKFWFVELAEGVARSHFGTLLYGAFTTIGLLAFVAIGTP